MGTGTDWEVSRGLSQREVGDTPDPHLLQSSLEGLGRGQPQAPSGEGGRDLKPKKQGEQPLALRLASPPGPATRKPCLQ